MEVCKIYRISLLLLQVSRSCWCNVDDETDVERFTSGEVPFPWSVTEFALRRLNQLHYDNVSLIQYFLPISIFIRFSK